MPAVYLHHLPQLFEQAGLDPVALQSQPYHIGVSCLVLLVPGALAAAMHATGAVIATAPGAPAVDAAPVAAADSGILATSAKDARPTSPGIANALRVLRVAGGSAPAATTGAKAAKAISRHKYSSNITTSET